MKKFVLAILIMGIVCALMSCKKNSADAGANTENTTAETSVSAEAVTHEPIETVETFQINLQEGQVGAVAPD